MSTVRFLAVCVLCRTVCSPLVFVEKSPFKNLTYPAFHLVMEIYFQFYCFFFTEKVCDTWIFRAILNSTASLYILPFNISRISNMFFYILIYLITIVQTEKMPFENTDLVFLRQCCLPLLDSEPLIMYDFFLIHSCTQLVDSFFLYFYFNSFFNEDEGMKISSITLQCDRCPSSDLILLILLGDVVKFLTTLDVVGTDYRYSFLMTRESLLSKNYAIQLMNATYIVWILPWSVKL